MVGVVEAATLEDDGGQTELAPGDGVALGAALARWGVEAFGFFVIVSATAPVFVDGHECIYLSLTEEPSFLGRTASVINIANAK